MTDRAEKSSVRTTINLPVELYRRLNGRPELNWSKICAEALRAELQGPINLELRLVRLEEELSELKRQVAMARKALGG